MQTRQALCRLRRNSPITNSKPRPPTLRRAAQRKPQSRDVACRILQNERLWLDFVNRSVPVPPATVLCNELYYFGINKQLQSRIRTVYCQINVESDIPGLVFIAPAQPAPATEGLNGNRQLPVVDALADQTAGKCCLSYKINSIFSGSCARNNSYYISPAVLNLATNCMSHSPSRVPGHCSHSSADSGKEGMRSGWSVCAEMYMRVWCGGWRKVAHTHQSAAYPAAKDMP